MNELKLSGKIKLINGVQTFDSGFVKREFILTTSESYPQDVKFELVKETATNFEKHNKVGDVVDVLFNVRGNFYNEKYYVNLQAWRVSKAESTPVTANEGKEEAVDDSPF